MLSIRASVKLCHLIKSQPFPKKALVFTCLREKSFENTVGKGEIARNEQFLLFPQCYLTFKRAFSRFYQVSNCRLQPLPNGGGGGGEESKICHLGKV